jgi:ActR/RegA family two-component response regulator
MFADPAEPGSTVDRSDRVSRSRYPNRGGRPAVLVIDDDQGARETFNWALTMGGFWVETAGSGGEGLALARSDRFDLLVIDLQLPDMLGTDVVRSLISIEEKWRFVLVSGFLTVPTVVEAMKLGAADVIEKPVSVDQLLTLAVALAGAPQAVPEMTSPAPTSAAARDRRASAAITLPGSIADRWARHVLKACESERDLKTLQLWATYAGVSYTSLRESCGLVGIQPHDARDLTRVLRAVIQADRHRCSPDMFLDVSDRRTIEALFERAGLDASSRRSPVSVERFLAAQHFVVGHNAALRVLRRLLGERFPPNS